MLRMIVRVGLDATSCHQDERGVNMDWEPDTAILLTIQLELLLLGRLVECLVFLFFILHLFLDCLVYFT